MDNKKIKIYDIYFEHDKNMVSAQMSRAENGVCIQMTKNQLIVLKKTLEKLIDPDAPNLYVNDNGDIIKWHVTDDWEIDYTKYVEEDGGRLDMDKNMIDKPYSLLEDV